jgi:hypothetical protein
MYNRFQFFRNTMEVNQIMISRDELKENLKEIQLRIETLRRYL